MVFIGMCFCEGYGFQAVYSKDVLPCMCNVKGVVFKQLTLERYCHIWAIYVGTTVNAIVFKKFTLGRYAIYS